MKKNHVRVCIECVHDEYINSDTPCPCFYCDKHDKVIVDDYDTCPDYEMKEWVKEELEGA